MKFPVHSLPNDSCKGTVPLLPYRQNKTLFISVFSTMIHTSLKPPLIGYDFSLYVISKQDTSYLYVTVRPGLIEFLHAAKKTCFEIVTFSWLPREYVSPILHKIDPTGQLITHRLYLDCCYKTGQRKVLMDIRQTGRKLDQCVIIDSNHPYLYVRPWCNLIRVRPCTGDPNDVEFPDLLRFLEAQENFINLQDLIHVSSMAPVLPDLPLPKTTRKTLFLDLDETLIRYVSRDRKPPDSYDFMTEWGCFIIRPGVDKLLQAAAGSGYEIVIFTAGIINYAAPIIDKLDPKGLIAHRLYRDSCKRNEQGEPIKDLSLTGRSLDKCIMVDDVWRRVIQRENVVMIKPFMGDLNDSELMKLLPYFSIESKDVDLVDLVSHINRQLGYLNL